MIEISFNLERLHLEMRCGKVNEFVMFIEIFIYALDNINFKYNEKLKGFRNFLHISNKGNNCSY